MGRYPKGTTKTREIVWKCPQTEVREEASPNKGTFHCYKNFKKVEPILSRDVKKVDVISEPNYSTA